MSKNKSYRQAANYNRPSAGYQKNLYKQKLNEEGIKAPKAVDSKKLRIILIGMIVVWVIITVLLILKLRWWGLLIGVVIGAACAGGVYYYLRRKQNGVIKYYKQIGLNENQYINELRKRNVPAKQLDAYRKIWRKVKI